jgi:AhpD family alkylhydroperoxidase
MNAVATRWVMRTAMSRQTRAVSVTKGCDYCIASHTASARRKGLSTAKLAELIAVVGMANETNRLAQAWRVPVDAWPDPPEL